MQRSKVVQDPVHGSIEVDGVFLDVMDRHEMQRLRSVRQRTRTPSAWRACCTTSAIRRSPTLSSP